MLLGIDVPHGPYGPFCRRLGCLPFAVVTAFIWISPNEEWPHGSVSTRLGQLEPAEAFSPSGRDWPERRKLLPGRLAND